MKYIKVRFPGQSREYTYSCDDDSVSPGDEVSVSTPFGVEMTLAVVEVSDNAPSFPCKPAMKVT